MWTRCISIWSWGGSFSFPYRQTSCCHEQNLLFMGIGIPFPFMCFNCDIWKYYSGNLLPSGSPVASTPAPLMHPFSLYSKPISFPAAVPFRFSASVCQQITNRNHLMDRGQSFFQPINVTGDFPIFSVSITCHKVENTPATFEKAQIYLEVSPLTCS